MTSRQRGRRGSALKKQGKMNLNSFCPIGCSSVSHKRLRGRNQKPPHNYLAIENGGGTIRERIKVENTTADSFKSSAYRDPTQTAIASS
ncbi:hypothetical protein VTK26DRAFT_4890 [Humicola hyalothermophila]